jgi:hypothetical protein
MYCKKAMTKKLQIEMNISLWPFHATIKKSNYIHIESKDVASHAYHNNAKTHVRVW